MSTFSTRFGTNLKLDVARRHQAAFDAVLREVFAAEPRVPFPALTQYILADGFSIGVFWGDDDQVLPDAAWMRAPWLELAVVDVAETRAALAARGVEAVPYPQDPAHSYHRLPGGPVFRLAAR